MDSRVNRNNTLGALQVGGSVMLFLFGVETLQTYYYFKRYPNDRLWLKLLVIWIWLEEMGHTISALTAMYLLTVTEFGDPGALNVVTMPTGYAWSVVFSGSVGAIVEVFFAHRMYVLSGRRPDLPIIALCLASIRFIGSTIAASKVFGGISLHDFSTKWGWLNTLCFSAGAGADIIVTAGQCYYLYCEKSVAFERTLKQLDRLLTYTIETGLILSMSAVIILLLWGASPHNFWWFAVFLFYTEVCANSFMAALNTRKTQRDFGEVGVLRHSQSILEHSNSISRNSHRSQRISKFEIREDINVELGPRVRSDGHVSFPQHLPNHSDMTIVVPQKARAKHYKSVDLESQEW